MPDSPPASICVRDLTKRYGTVHALGGITFDVTEGQAQYVVTLGHRGSSNYTFDDLTKPDAIDLSIGTS